MTSLVIITKPMWWASEPRF